MTLDAEWVPLATTSGQLDDYQRWFDYHVSVVCAVFGLSPEQLGVAAPPRDRFAAVVMEAFR